MKYCVRFSFPKMCVTFNPGRDEEFKNSMIDFYSDSLDALMQIDPCKHERINMRGVKHYDRIISKWDAHVNMWVNVCSDTIRL